MTVLLNLIFIVLIFIIGAILFILFIEYNALINEIISYRIAQIDKRRYK